MCKFLTHTFIPYSSSPFRLGLWPVAFSMGAAKSADALDETLLPIQMLWQTASAHRLQPSPKDASMEWAHLMCIHTMASFSCTI